MEKKNQELISYWHTKKPQVLTEHGILLKIGLHQICLFLKKIELYQLVAINMFINNYILPFTLCKHISSVIPSNEISSPCNLMDTFLSLLFHI